MADGHHAELQAPRLARLNLGYNQLSGEVPRWLAGLAALRFLFLNNNRLTGPFPAAIAEGAAARVRARAAGGDGGDGGADGVGLTRLQSLYLCNNGLGGDVPSGRTGGAARLEFLDINRNEFTGRAASQGSDACSTWTYPTTRSWGLCRWATARTRMRCGCGRRRGGAAGADARAAERQQVQRPVLNCVDDGGDDGDGQQYPSLHSLDLSRNALVGALPSLDLPSLAFVDVSHNALGGTGLPRSGRAWPSSASPTTASAAAWRCRRRGWDALPDLVAGMRSTTLDAVDALCDAPAALFAAIGTPARCHQSSTRSCPPQTRTRRPSRPGRVRRRGCGRGRGGGRGRGHGTQAEGALAGRDDACEAPRRLAQLHCRAAVRLAGAHGEDPLRCGAWCRRRQTHSN